MVKLNQLIENIVLKHDTGVVLCFEARFHYERGKEHSLFVLLTFFCARFNRRSIKETKNALFHARSGNERLAKILNRYIKIYAVIRNQVSLLIKAEVFDFFPLICYNVKRAMIQTMPRKHTHSDQV